MAGDIIGDGDSKGLFSWGWGTPDRLGNPPSRGRKMSHVYIQNLQPRGPGVTLLDVVA